MELQTLNLGPSLMNSRLTKSRLPSLQAVHWQQFKKAWTLVLQPLLLVKETRYLCRYLRSLALYPMISSSPWRSWLWMTTSCNSWSCPTWSTRLPESKMKISPTPSMARMQFKRLSKQSLTLCSWTSTFRYWMALRQPSRSRITTVQQSRIYQSSL